MSDQAPLRINGFADGLPPPAHIVGGVRHPVATKPIAAYHPSAHVVVPQSQLQAALNPNNDFDDIILRNAQFVSPVNVRDATQYPKAVPSTYYHEPQAIGFDKSKMCRGNSSPKHIQMPGGAWGHAR